MSVERVNRVTCNGCGTVRYTPQEDRLMREPWPPIPRYWTCVPVGGGVEPSTFCPACNLSEAGKESE